MQCPECGSTHIWYYYFYVTDGWSVHPSETDFDRDDEV